MSGRLLEKENTEHLAEGDRYACSYTSCRGETEVGTSMGPAVRYFPTWSELQRHIRDEHPPTCPYPECHGQTFTAQKGFRAHMRIHEDREREQLAHSEVHGHDDDDNPPTKKTRRGGDMGRDWTCSVEGCEMNFKSVRVHLLSSLDPSA